MKILVIDDEAKTGDYLRNGLTDAGYLVDVALNGIDGLRLAQEMRYDLIVLDVMMPQMDGWTVMQKLDTRLDSRVLFLSARGTREDRLKGLELGADDYLVKPFSFAELLARVRLILRRDEPVRRQPDLLEAGDLRVDIVKRRVARGDARITLTNREFTLLRFLMQHQAQVLPRALIASRVWDMNFDSDSNVVDVAVRRLRQKIDDPFPRRLIHTIYGVGYRFEYEA
ncbi:heavy metal response regulator transcription factor [Paraburkholderia sp. 2C]|jgi:two-component system, OmpR family, copper resistance phosphate regulon response regulator CusR